MTMTTKTFMTTRQGYQTNELQYSKTKTYGNPWYFLSRIKTI